MDQKEETLSTSIVEKGRCQDNLLDISKLSAKQEQQVTKEESKRGTGDGRGKLSSTIYHSSIMMKR